MQLPFERWASQTVLPDAARLVFGESSLCYKSGANRAALLFGYVGWGLTLRERLLAASSPSAIPPGQWGKLLNDLRKEDKWDSAVFDATQQAQPKAIFDVSDDLRNQVKYWKDRRNDCAHFKDNEISAAHVEALWQFIQCNLAKFVVGGSVPDLIARFARHFDPNFTPPGADFAPVAALVPSAVPVAELPKFLAGVERALTGTVGLISAAQESELCTAMEGMLALNNPSISQAVLQFLTPKEDLLVAVFRANPRRVMLLTGNPPLVRCIWKACLFRSHHRDLSVLASLFRNGLIPQAEKQEALRAAVVGLRNEIPENSDLATLQAEGFVCALREWAFRDGNANEFGWGNRNAAVIAWLLEQFPITGDIAGFLCRTFDSLPFPFLVAPEIRKMLATNPAKKAEFVAAAAQVGATPPSTLV